MREWPLARRDQLFVSPSIDCNTMLAVHSGCNEQLAIMRESHMLDPVRQRLLEPDNVDAALLGACGVPDHKPWSEAHLASRAVLPARIDRHAEYIIVVLHHESLRVLALVEDDTNASCMVDHLAFAIVPQVVSCIMAAVAVYVLQVEGRVRPVGVEDGAGVAYSSSLSLRNLIVVLVIVDWEAVLVKLKETLAVFGVLSA